MYSFKCSPRLQVLDFGLHQLERSHSTPIARLPFEAYNSQKCNVSPFSILHKKIQRQSNIQSDFLTAIGNVQESMWSAFYQSEQVTENNCIFYFKIWFELYLWNNWYLIHLEEQKFTSVIPAQLIWGTSFEFVFQSPPPPWRCIIVLSIITFTYHKLACKHKLKCGLTFYMSVKCSLSIKVW